MTATVHRIEVHRRPEAGDPAADALRRDAAGLPNALIPSSVACAAVYLLEGALTDSELVRIAEELLADPVMQSAVIGAAAPAADQVVIEVHPLPGVMDPAAASIATAIAALVGEDRGSGIVVRTGRRYTFGGIDAEAGRELATRLLANRSSMRFTPSPISRLLFRWDIINRLKFATFRSANSMLRPSNG